MVKFECQLGFNFVPVGTNQVEEQYPNGENDSVLLVLDD